MPFPLLISQVEEEERQRQAEEEDRRHQHLLQEHLKNILPAWNAQSPAPAPEAAPAPSLADIQRAQEEKERRVSTKLSYPLGGLKILVPFAQKECTLMKLCTVKMTSDSQVHEVFILGEGIDCLVVIKLNWV